MKGWLYINESSKGGRGGGKKKERKKGRKNVRVTLTASNNFQDLFS